MKSCRCCISYCEDKDNLERACRVESQAMNRVERRIGSLLDAFTINYFQVMLDLFTEVGSSDDCTFFGQRCFFYVEESQVEKAG